MEVEGLSGFISQIEVLTKEPEKYLSLQENEAEKIKMLTKNLYNFAKKYENVEFKTPESLEKLIIENLDEEQIWQQVELQNNSICNNLVHNVAHLLAKKDSLKFPLSKEKKIEVQSNADRKSVKKKIVKEGEKSDIKTKNKVPQSKVKSSIVDDKFFKLHEMENFLEKIEQGDKNIESSEDEIDYFEDESSELSEHEGTQLHYNDFFDEPEDENVEKSSEILQANGEKEKKVNFLLEREESELERGSEESSESLEDEFLYCNNSKDHDSSDIDNEESSYNEIENNYDEDGSDDKFMEEGEDDNYENADEIPEQPSAFEARQERLKSRIKDLEEKALQEKPWQLKGEITANSRPQNSLLEEYVDFDIATRPAPILTEKSTLKLEDVIIQRINDKAWDDVVRKIKPVESEIEYKKKLVLDQEKSKLSLAQIYEQEYLKQLDNKKEVIDKPEMEAPEHQEIRIMMTKLFSKLDALSNFHFTPKQVAPEVKIVGNLPAISMEEVAPTATSDATLLAPEEVKPKLRGDLKAKSERTATDKKRERRQKKLKQKLKFKQIEAKAKSTLEKPNSKNSKDSQDKKISQKFLQKITKSSNAIQLDKSEGGKYIKSSNAFFSKLQDKTSSVLNKQNLDVKKRHLKK